jgi:hypothetical protein
MRQWKDRTSSLHGNLVYIQLPFMGIDNLSARSSMYCSFYAYLSTLNMQFLSYPASFIDSLTILLIELTFILKLSYYLLLKQTTTMQRVNVHF